MEGAFSTGNILTCILFSRGEGPRSTFEVVPLVSHMTGINPLQLLSSPVELLIGAVLCGQELAQQHSALIAGVDWPEEDATDEVLGAWYEQQTEIHGKLLNVESFLEGLQINELDTQTLLAIHPIVEKLFMRMQ